MNDTTNAPSTEIPYGYCHCGCGQKTNIAPYTSERFGWVNGEPLKYIHTHRTKLKEPCPPPNPSGLCMCGCGKPAPIAPETSLSKGVMAGQAMRFIHGHHRRRDHVERFWEHVDKRGPDECWEWTAGLHDTGYGHLGRTNGTHLTHRISYEIHYGPIPAGMNVCHKCDNRKCVNPNHLFLGTDADNMADKVSKGRQLKGSQNPCVKLTESDIPVIRSLYQSGVLRSEIARMYNVGPGAINDIIKGVTWTHVK